MFEHVSSTSEEPCLSVKNYSKNTLLTRGGTVVGAANAALLVGLGYEGTFSLGGPVWGCDKLVSRAKVIENQVMAAPIISISSDSSDESVGSSSPRVILIGSISIEVYVALEVAAAAVASPVGVSKLNTHSSSDPNTSESSLPSVPVAPMVSPFLHLDDSESDTELPERHISFAPHDAILARWRSRVASRPSSPSGSSSPTTSTLEIPTAPIPPAPSTDIISPIDAPPGVHQRRTILL
ncbi:hypothetical protein Tco_0539702 [Tanacetum coccineum]